MEANEKWYHLIELEIYFYKNYQQYRAEIEEKLKESTYIKFPVSHYTELGISYGCPGPEDQAITRILKREHFEHMMEQAKKRIERLVNAYQQLSDIQQQVIDLYYFSPLRGTQAQIARVVGLRIKEFDKTRIQALKDMYKIYSDERKDEDIAFREERKRMREEMRRGWFAAYEERKESLV